MIKIFRYVVERISNNRRQHIMRLLEDLPAVEDDFEMLLSRRVSTNTEFEEANMGSQPMNESLLNEVALKVRNQIYRKFIVKISLDLLIKPERMIVIRKNSI